MNNTKKTFAFMAFLMAPFYEACVTKIVIKDLQYSSTSELAIHDNVYEDQSQTEQRVIISYRESSLTEPTPKSGESKRKRPALRRRPKKKVAPVRPKRRVVKQKPKRRPKKNANRKYIRNKAQRYNKSLKKINKKTKHLRKDKK